jgi:hypothetical protein
MHEFTSKPIQIDNEMVLCEDGSIWDRRGSNEFFQIASHTPPKKEKKTSDTGESHYPNEFTLCWTQWGTHIKNNSNKRQSYLSWKKLSDEEKSMFFTSIIPYSRISTDHKYLKRCETYINQKHWESLEIAQSIAETFKEEPINRDVNLKGKF